MNDDDDVMSLGEGVGESSAQTDETRGMTEVRKEDTGDGMAVGDEVRESSLGVPPTVNEIRLGRKVLDLEKERHELHAELERMRARYPSHSTTIPIPQPSSTSTSVQPIAIPHDLLPTLNLLRHHISELTRDNQALRYTFLGEGEPSSSNVTLESPDPAKNRGGTSGVDLKAVVRRVRDVMRENEELGEMLIEAGRGRGAEWQKAIDDSKAVIESLELDLAHHLSVVQSVRAELVAYKTHFGPIPTPGVQSTTALSPTISASPIIVTPLAPKLTRAGSISTSGAHSRHDRRRDSERHREKDREKPADRAAEHKLGESRHGRVQEEQGAGTRGNERGNTGGDGSRRGGKESDRDRDYKRRR